MKRLLLVIAALLSLTVLMTACKKGRRYDLNARCIGKHRCTGHPPPPPSCPPMRPMS